MSEIIMDTDDRAAMRRTDIAGWVSRHGRFFGDGPDNERVARYDGCTHIACKKCGAITERARVVCDSCHSKHMDAIYSAMPRKPWDGTTPVCIFESDTYFFSLEDAETYCEDNGTSLDELRLVHCDPVYGRDVDGAFYSDELPEDGELPDEIQKAADALNAIVKAHGPLSWVQGKVAVEKTPKGGGE